MVIVLTPLADDQYSPFQHFLPGSETESPCRSARLYEECTQTNTISFKVIKRTDGHYTCTQTHTHTIQSNHYSSNSEAARERIARSHVLLYMPRFVSL